MTKVMMKCGHAANADHDGSPACAICAGINRGWDEVDDENVLLTGREARCSCGHVRPSNVNLPFFEYRGDGSKMATDSCKNCGYSEVAHTQEPTRTQQNVVLNGKCPGFEPRGAWEYDSYYCGCRGWD